MSSKDVNVRRGTWNSWYKRNKDEAIRRKNERRQLIMNWLKEYKNTHTCVKCGEDHPACLQFHHLDPKSKDINMSSAAKQGWSINRIETEIAKCIMVCANCHFKEHFNLGLDIQE